jgi:hypothetical protein
MPTLRFHARRAQSYGAKGRTAVWTLALSLIAMTPLHAQAPSTADSTLLNEWVQSARNDALQAVSLFSLDHLKQQPLFGSWGATNDLDRYWDAFNITRETFSLFTDPLYRQQPAEARFEFDGILLKSASFAGGEAFWADTLGGPIMASRDNLHRAELMYNAVAHQREAQSLAFGGVLSKVRLPDIRFATSDLDGFGASFHSWGAENRTSAAGSWTAVYGSRDVFNAQSRYTFDRLQSNSGHVFTGTGIVARERVEQRGMFAHEPLLNWINLFNFSSPMKVTETTRRSESYSDSFNGAQVNRSIQSTPPPPQPAAAAKKGGVSLGSPDDFRSDSAADGWALPSVAAPKFSKDK